jgi:hypothetical protein
MVAVGGFSCEMFSLEVGGYLIFPFGYNAAQLLGTCVDFVDPAPALKAGYAFVILATIFGGLTVVAAVLAAFIRFPPSAVPGMSILAFVVAGFGALVCGVAFAVAECQTEGNVCKPNSMMSVVMAGTLSWIRHRGRSPFVDQARTEGRSCWCGCR